MNRTTLGEFAYHGLALVAMVIHVVPVGLMYLLALALRSRLDPGGQGEVLLKAAFAITWIACFGVGLYLWYLRNWLVIAIPVVSIGVGFGLARLGRVMLEWVLPIGN